MASVCDRARRQTLLLTLLCVSLVTIVILESLFSYWQKVSFSAVGQSATTDILEHVFTHVQTLPKSTGDTPNRRRDSPFDLGCEDLA